MATGGVRGGRQIATTLRALSGAISPRDVREVQMREMTAMQSAARAHFELNGSRVTGVIPDDIAVAHTGPLQTSMALTGMGAKLGHLIEFGTAPHYQPNRGQMHPGASPKPFMRPALDEVGPEALRGSVSAYALILASVARRLSRG